MSLLVWIFAGLVLLALAGLAGGVLLIHRRHMQRWLPVYVSPPTPREAPRLDGPLELFIAVCDHFEPECYGTLRGPALERVRRWVRDYPRLFGEFRDHDGRPPQHTFFFPQDEYRPEYLDELKRLIDLGYGDVDVHLHHYNDNAERLREKLEGFRDTLYHRHGLLRRDPQTGEVVYGFIHGNWALCNSMPDGDCCGVDQELTVLKETGCYADFTYPSAPSPTQPPILNSIYYARDIPGRRGSHEVGIPARVGQPAPADHLLLIQGPLMLDWGRAKFGVLPRIENADLTGGRGASIRRLQLWLRAGVHVLGQPNWIFIKLHTHGCKPANVGTLLGPEMQRFHSELAAWAARRPGLRYHYVTAWEMARLVHAAERRESWESILRARERMARRGRGEGGTGEVVRPSADDTRSPRPALASAAGR
jgi:hypothetical protein